MYGESVKHLLVILVELHRAECRRETVGATLRIERWVVGISQRSLGGEEGISGEKSEGMR